MRILFALPGFHRYDRGAEIALSSVASELATSGDDVTLIGSGEPREEKPYRFIHAASIRRERFEWLPSLPVFRNNTSYEEATFAVSLAAKFRPRDYDVTITCSFPFTNWVLRRPTLVGRRPPHVFVTQNGDWPSVANNSEYRFFGCDGLVCTNPDYFENNRELRRCAMIPNGIDVAKFSKGIADRAAFGLREDAQIVLMVSAHIESKRVEQGIRAVAAIAGAHLVVAGDGPLRERAEALANDLMPGRYRRISVPAAQMPALYRSADVFLHLSEYESFGNVYVEAMASGLPVVAHDNPRNRWLVGDEEYLVDSTNLEALSLQIDNALNKKLPVRDAQRAVERFSIAAVAESYRSFFRQIAGKA